jgi:plasmid stabilization system protein ParE
MVRFHPAAEAEHLDTIAFYESRQPGLGGSYLHEFEAALSRISQSPTRYRIERKPDIRLLSLIQFPLKIIYRVASGSVQILAVAHKRRRPGYWVGRL